MKRTTLSILGGLLFLGMSLGVGVAGGFWSVYANADMLVGKLRQQVEAVGKSGTLSPEDQKKLEETKAQLAKMEADLANPEKRAARERFAPYGYFEIAVGLVGLLAGIIVLAASSIGKLVGVLAGTLGVLSCVWGVVIGAPPGMPAAALIQVGCLIVFGLATIGALSLKKKEPELLKKEAAQAKGKS
jgi:predicted cobalt transporter CbtA